VVLRRFPKKAGLSCATITEVIHAIRSGAATFGIVPIENSSGGTITETVDLLIEHTGDIFIREELALDVRLALLGHAGTEFKNLRTLYSHVMPLRHHREWIRENLPGAKLVECSSTAEAAKKAALSANAAALAAPGAADLYGLAILKFPVRPEAVNITHFFVLGGTAVKQTSFIAEGAKTSTRKRNEGSLGKLAKEPVGKCAEVSIGKRAEVSIGKRAKTAIVAALPQVSGSLHRFLGPFARTGVNLCRIVSRPVPGHPETYVFYLEVEGAVVDPRVAKALAGAKRLAVRLEIPGSYPLGPRYLSPRR
jgi:prephenate dehydratase